MIRSGFQGSAVVASGEAGIAAQNARNAKMGNLCDLWVLSRQIPPGTAGLAAVGFMLEGSGLGRDVSAVDRPVVRP
jgi:hypothetical protein